jgi:pilus assembly protein CpaB
MERQKALLIFVAAGISAAILTWFLYRTTQAPRAPKTVKIQAAAHDMAAGTLLKKSDLKTVDVTERDLPKAAIVDAAQAIDHPLLFPVSANELITGTKIASTRGIDGLASVIEVGKRAISVPITDSSGVAGLIQPRAHVDVLFTKPGSATEAVTTTIIEDVVVLAMGRTTEGTSVSTAAAAAQATARPSAQSATLLVTPEQTQKLELAKNQGKISLALRNPLDNTVANDLTPTKSRDLYPVVEPVRVQREPPPEKPQVIVQKVEQPKPRSIIDVFRGEKRTQEVFK